jgi:hypothetical protein
MYDSNMNEGNPICDLNRQLISEDNRIIVIFTRDIMQGALKEILSIHAESPRE